MRYMSKELKVIKGFFIFIMILSLWVYHCFINIIYQEEPNKKIVVKVCNKNTRLEWRMLFYICSMLIMFFLLGMLRKKKAFQFYLQIEY